VIRKQRKKAANYKTQTAYVNGTRMPGYVVDPICRRVMTGEPRMRLLTDHVGSSSAALKTVKVGILKLSRANASSQILGSRGLARHPDRNAYQPGHLPERGGGR
jgi:hypothetical protein